MAYKTHSIGMTKRTARRCKAALERVMDMVADDITEDEYTALQWLVYRLNPQYTPPQPGMISLHDRAMGEDTP